MNPHKVNRARLEALTDLPNVGSATARDLQLLGFETPEMLVGQCPFEMYRQLCAKTGVSHDPCVIDVFMSITEFLNGTPALPWWNYTEARKERAASMKLP